MLTLALGIGFTTATFSVINAVLLKPLPFAQPDRLMLVRERKLPPFPEFSVAPGHYLTWRERTRTFDDLAAWGGELVNLDTGSADPERVRAARVTAHLFPLLGAAPVAGRAFSTSDDTDGAPAVALIWYGTWQRRFGGRRDAVGQSIRLDSEPVTIVGVMAAGLTFPNPETEIWVPMAFTADERQRNGRRADRFGVRGFGGSGTGSWFNVRGRVRCSSSAFVPTNPAPLCPPHPDPRT